MIEESKNCSDVIKKHFNKELVMTKKDKENLRTLLNNGFLIMIIDNDVQVKDYCHFTGKYRGSAHRDFNINLKLNYKILVVFHNLKNYNFDLIMQEIGKLNLKVNIIPNVLERFMIFINNNKLSLIDSFQVSH